MMERSVWDDLKPRYRDLVVGGFSALLGFFGLNYALKKHREYRSRIIEETAERVTELMQNYRERDR